MNDLAIRRPRLLHYSQKAQLKRALQSRAQLHPYGDMTGAKPLGLWFSVEGDDDWLNWCRGEGFRMENLRHVHEITMRPIAKLLWLDTAEAVLEFAKKYAPTCTASDVHASIGNPLLALQTVAFLEKEVGRRVIGQGIDWRNVAAEYDGIAIAPYQWSLRMHQQTFWYYTWDCASGCIWNVNAIESIKLVNEPVVTEKEIKRSIHKRTPRRKFKKSMKRLRAWSEGYHADKTDAQS